MSRKRLITLLGFDFRNITINASNDYSKNGSISFQSIDEAQRYFQMIKTYKNFLVQGNIRSFINLKPNFDPIDYIKGAKMEAMRRTSGSIVCILPYYLCGEDEFDDGADNNGEHATSLNHWIAWTGYNVSFNWISSSGQISASGFNSNLIGFHLGVSWDQTSASYVNYPNSALIYFTINGLQHYNVIVEGVGTVFTETVTITGIYNTNTGAYTITVN